MNANGLEFVLTFNWTLALVSILTSTNKDICRYWPENVRYHAVIISSVIAA